MKTKYTIEDVIAMLKERQAGRSVADLSADLGVTPAYVYDIYKGNRMPGPSILKSLKLTAEKTVSVIYRRMA